MLLGIQSLGSPDSTFMPAIAKIQPNDVRNLSNVDKIHQQELALARETPQKEKEALEELEEAAKQQKEESSNTTAATTTDPPNARELRLPVPLLSLSLAVASALFLVLFS